MRVELARITDKPEEIIEIAGRTCYQSFGSMPNPKVIQKWIKSGHESIIEHASATFRIYDVSLALLGQLVRHRIASFSVMSFRFTDGSEFTNVIPPDIDSDPYVKSTYDEFIKSARGMYKMLRAKGIKKEDARMVLPQATHTNLVVTMNFRELRHMFGLRLHKTAQWEFREMAGKMLELVKPQAPNVFHDISVEGNYE